MSSKDFYDCTWYDWSLWCSAIREKQRRRTEDQELIIEMVRSSLTCYFNWNRSDKQQPMSKLDLFPSWRLSYDDTEEGQGTDREPTEEEKAQLQETIKRLEAVHKKKKRG